MKKAVCMNQGTALYLNQT